MPRVATAALGARLKPRCNLIRSLIGDREEKGSLRFGGEPFLCLSDQDEFAEALALAS